MAVAGFKSCSHIAQQQAGVYNAAWGSTASATIKSRPGFNNQALSTPAAQQAAPVLLLPWDCFGGKSLLHCNNPQYTKCTGLVYIIISLLQLQLGAFSLPSGFILSNPQLLELHVFLPNTSPSTSEMLKSF